MKTTPHSNQEHLKSAVSFHLSQIPSDIFKVMPGQKNLLDSFEFLSQHAPTDFFTKRGAFTRNVFSQHLLIDDSKIPDSSTYSGDFKKFSDSIYSSLHISHETLQVFLWEPFFTGSFKLKSLNQYKNLARCFEALAFWYTDIWLIPKLRSKLPDGSFTFSRSTLSSPYFQPDVALGALGMKNPNKILDLYLNSFTSKQQKKLSQEILQFYTPILKTTDDHFSTLKRTGIFDEYWSRFCKIKKIPSLMGEQISASLQKETLPLRYTKLAYTEGLPAVGRLSSKKIHAIFQRRGIQTRAYTLFAMRDLFLENRVIRPSQNTVNTARYLKLIHTAIDHLEGIMNELCSGDESTPQHIDFKIHEFDEIYENHLRAAFKKDSLYVRNFHQIFPKGENVGLIESGECKSHKDLLNRYLSAYSQLGSNAEQFLSHSKKDLALQIQLGQQLTIFKNRKMTKKQINQWVAQYNQWLCSPALISQWSRPLETQSFKNGYLIELGYSYE